MLNEIRECKERQAKVKGGDRKGNFVPRPAGGFPIVHRDYPSGILENISHESYETWLAKDSNAVIAVAHFLNSWMGGRAGVTATLIKVAVKSFYNLDTLFVAPAIPAEEPGPEDEGAAPHIFGLLHISENLARALITQGCIANARDAGNEHVRCPPKLSPLTHSHPRPCPSSAQ